MPKRWRKNTSLSSCRAFISVTFFSADSKNFCNSIRSKIHLQTDQQICHHGGCKHEPNHLIIIRIISWGFKVSEIRIQKTLKLIQMFSQFLQLHYPKHQKNFIPPNSCNLLHSGYCGNQNSVFPHIATRVLPLSFQMAQTITSPSVSYLFVILEHFWMYLTTFPSIPHPCSYQGLNPWPTELYRPNLDCFEDPHIQLWHVRASEVLQVGWIAADHHMTTSGTCKSHIHTGMHECTHNFFF